MMLRCLLLLLCALLTACAPSGPLVLTVTSPELVATVQEAAEEWRTVCGVNVSLGEGGVVVELNADGLTPTQHGMTYKDYWGEPQSIRLRFVEDGTAARHEIGHALGVEHNPASGLMMRVVHGEQHVTPGDCAGITR